MFCGSDLCTCSSHFQEALDSDAEKRTTLEEVVAHNKRKQEVSQNEPKCFRESEVTRVRGANKKCVPKVLPDLRQWRPVCVRFLVFLLLST